MTTRERPAWVGPWRLWIARWAPAGEYPHGLVAERRWYREYLDLQGCGECCGTTKDYKGPVVPFRASMLRDDTPKINRRVEP